MSQSVRRHAFPNACVSRCLRACVPNTLVRHGLVLTAVTIVTGKQIGSRFLPAPVLTERF
jgi:hypothetical protein